MSVLSAAPIDGARTAEAGVGVNRHSSHLIGTAHVGRKPLPQIMQREPAGQAGSRKLAVVAGIEPAARYLD